MTLSVVIPTIYEPVTIDLLVPAAKKAGHEVIVIKDMPTNDAWRRGIEMAEHDRIMLLNDDVKINNSFFEWVDEAFNQGATYVCSNMVDRFYHNEKVIDWGSEPVHKGHAFSLMRGICEPVPVGFRIYYGDDWYYYQHVAKGRPCIALNSQFMTGRAAGINDDFSGFTAGQPDIDDKMMAMIGKTFLEQKKDEHEMSSRYFRFHDILGTTAVSYTDVNEKFRGAVKGLRMEVLTEEIEL